jgi:hypothetical protein
MKKRPLAVSAGILTESAALPTVVKTAAVPDICVALAVPPPANAVTVADGGSAIVSVAPSPSATPPLATRELETVTDPPTLIDPGDVRIPAL